MLISRPIPNARLAGMLEDFGRRHAMQSSQSPDGGLIAECITRLRGAPDTPAETATRLRVYLAGPMTGLPQHNYPAFHAAAERLREMGWHVENPAENPEPPCKSWSAYMRMAVAQLVTCDYVALLPGWESSKGAGVEWRLACDLGLPVSPIEKFTAPVIDTGADFVAKVGAKASKKVKRFVLFAGRDHDHTAGGWREYWGDYDHLHEARDAGIASRMDWWNVIDLQTGEEVANGD